MAALSDSELAFAENLILMGAVPGPRLIYPLLMREQDSRPLWDLVQELQLATPQAIKSARQVAENALQALGTQAFSFSEGAMVGPWELIERRGGGIGGEAWYATQPGGKQATVRVISPGSGHDNERTQRFVERSNAGLDPPHPSILKIDEAEEDFGWLYTATHNMDCQPLMAMRTGGQAVPETTALALAQSMAGSLGVVHELGVVHGGLTPLGVLIRERRTYISDFGICSALLDGPAYGCRPGGRLGVLLFASPQLIVGDAARGLDARDDLYSLGACVYFGICDVTGPGERSSPQAPWSVEPPVSDGLKTILTRLMAPHPEARYASTTGLQDDLGRVVSGALPGPLPPPSGIIIRGRRHPTAAPQEALSVELLQSVLSPPTQEIMPDPVPVEVEAEYEEQYDSAEYEEQYDSAEYESEDDEEYEPRKSYEAPSARVTPSTRYKDTVKAKKKGGGWLLFAMTTVIVLGGMSMAYLLTQPEGKDLGRSNLATAFRVARADPPNHGEALGLVKASFPHLDKDGARDAILLYDEIDRRALDERAELLPKGSQSTDAELDEVLEKLEDLLARSEGCRVEPLLLYDLARRDDAMDNVRWAQLGADLLENGHPAEAADAYTRAAKEQEAAFARSASVTLVFLRGGPYLQPAAIKPGQDVKEEDLELVQRAPCYLGRTEVTRAQYFEFVKAKGSEAHPYPSICEQREPAEKIGHAPKLWDLSKKLVDLEGPTFPAQVDFFDAISYARWRGMTLPDATTLFAAARGPTARPYPWGSAKPEPGLINVGSFLKGPAPVGCFDADRGPSGVLDLVGNLEEWVWVKKGGQGPVFGSHYATEPGDVRAGLSESIPLGKARKTAGFRVMHPLKKD